MKRIFGTLALFSLALSTALHAQDVQKSVNVTIYNNNLGVIRDVRSLNFNNGENEIRVTDVAEHIDPTSVHIKLNGTVTEQNYRYDLVDMTKILEKYIDKEITLMGEKGPVTGTLLSVRNMQIVLRKSDGGLAMIPDVNKYQISVGSLPEGLITRPTLVWNVNTSRAGAQDVELTYQTAGIAWHAEYVAVLNETDTKMDLNSWVSIDNHSGATYNNAVLKLVAGDVNIIQPPSGDLTGMYDAMERKTMAAAPQFAERAFFEYHIYDLQRPATIADNEMKQISMFEASGVNVTKKYLYRSGDYYPVYDRSGNSGNKVAVAVEFENKKSNNMGMPIPAGKVRIYKTDGKTTEFVGEDMVDHTPKDEKISLKLGNAFDIVAEEVTEDQKQISKRSREETIKITLKNRKEENVTVDVEKVLGYSWEIKDASMKYEKKDSRTALFKVPVNKGEEVTIRFTVRYNY